MKESSGRLITASGIIVAGGPIASDFVSLLLPIDCSKFQRIANPHLHQHLAAVSLHRSHGDAKSVGDLFVHRTSQHQIHDLDLVDPVHFGIILIVNMEIGLATPPVGLNLYVGSAISRLGLTEVSKSVVPWLLTAIVFLMMITYIPEITLFLPRLLGM